MTLPTETRRDGDVGDDEGYVKPSGLSSFSDAADGVNPHHPADDDFNSPEDPNGDEVDGLDGGIDYEFCIESQPSDDGDDELEHENDHSGDFGPTQQRLLSNKELRRHERKQRRLQKKRERKEEAKKKRRQATAASVAVAASSLGKPTTSCDGTTRAAYASVSEHFAHDNNAVDDDNHNRQQQRRRQRERLGEDQWKVRIQHAMTDFEIAIDGSFGSVMTERERTSLAQQIRYCYSYNKRSVRPSLVAVTDLQENGATNNNTSSSSMCMSSSPSLLQLLQREIGFEMWHQRAFTCTGMPLLSYYKDNPKRLVCLTSDATTTLHALDPDTVYIIGGIVDRNRLKGATHRRATTELDVPTAKLPLDEYLFGMATTKVLTVNHVFDILLRTKQYQQQLLQQQQAQDEEGMTDGRSCDDADGCHRDGCNYHHEHCRIIRESWTRAFQEVLPTRKGATFRG